MLCGNGYKYNNIKMLKDFVIAIISLVPVSIQHYIAPPDQCVLAQMCNHTWVAQCGYEIKDRNTRWFLDDCDMYEYNCDNKKNYENITKTECSNKNTDNTTIVSATPINNSSISRTTTAPTTNLENFSSEGTSLITSFVMSTTDSIINNTATAALMNNSSISRNTTAPTTALQNISNEGISLITSVVVGTTQMPTDNTVNKSAISMSTAPIQSSETVTVSNLYTADTQEINLNNSNNLTTKRTASSNMDSVKMIKTDITTESTILSTLQSTVKLYTANISFSCTHIENRTDSIPHTHKESIMKYNITTTEVSAITEFISISVASNKTKEIFITTAAPKTTNESTTKFDSTLASLSSTSSIDTNDLKAVTTAITERILTTNNSTSALKETTSTTANSFKDILKNNQTVNVIENITKVNRSIFSVNLSDITTIRSIRETTNTRNNIPYTTKENTQVNVTCKDYPKECDRPVTWETTEKGETRDFYQILKARYGNKVRLLRDTTHWPILSLRYYEDRDSFVFGRHNDIGIK